MPVIATPISSNPDLSPAHPGSGGRWYVSVAPTCRPVTASDLNSHLRYPEEPDVTLNLFIDAATEYAESVLGAALMPRTIVERFYDGASLDLSVGPLISVLSIVDNESTTLTGFTVRQTGHTSRLNMTKTGVYPLTVTYRAGYALPNGTTTAVPADIKLAILMHAATLYSNRESITDKASTPVPHTLEAFYAQKRRSAGVA